LDHRIKIFPFSFLFFLTSLHSHSYFSFFPPPTSFLWASCLVATSSSCCALCFVASLPHLATLSCCFVVSSYCLKLLLCHLVLLFWIVALLHCLIASRCFVVSHYLVPIAPQVFSNPPILLLHCKQKQAKI
jgi:hypothetical protein